MKPKNIRELITLGALDDVVQHQNGAVVTALEDQDILVLGLLVVQDLVDLEVHSLTGPHLGLLGEPAIWRRMDVLAEELKRIEQRGAKEEPDQPPQSINRSIEADGGLPKQRGVVGRP